LSYLLDTNACIRILNGTSAQLVERLRAHDPGELGLSAVVRAELLFGARKSSRVSSNLELLARFFAPFKSIPFDDVCAEHYGLLRAELERAGTPIGPNDMMIAATARAHDAVLVTANAEEFRRVVALRVENWEEA
jgi:tRNA(fMet)-specific endonuclease VapC